jgi:hypothetical protein
MQANQQPNWERPFILSVTLVLLGSLAWWMQYKHDPEKKAQEESAKKILALPKDTAITQVEFDNGAQTYLWNCVGDAGQTCKIGNNSKWQLQSPLKVQADNTNINALVSALDRLQAADTIDLKEETPEKRAAILKEYGLDASERSAATAKKVRVQTAKDGTWVAYFGNTHPVSDGYFTIVEHAGGKPDENRVFITPSFFKANFGHDLTYWRDKKLLSIGAGEVASFKIEGHLNEVPQVATQGAEKAAPKTNQKTTWIEGTKNGAAWTLRTPDGEFAGDTESIDSMLTGASFLAAKEITAEDKNNPEAKKILKQAKPLLTFSLSKAKGEPLTISLFEVAHAEKTPPSPPKKPSLHTTPLPGPTGTQLYATVSNMDPLFELQNSARNQLGKPLKDLRLAKLITSEDRFGAKKIEFAGKPLGDSPVTVTNPNGKWVLGSGDADAQIQNTLDKLSGKRIQDYLKTLPPNEAAGEANGLKVTLWTDTTAGTTPKRQLVFWKSGNLLYAHDLLSKQAAAYRVDPVVQSALPWNRDFFSAKPASAPPKSPPPLVHR